MLTCPHLPNSSICFLARFLTMNLRPVCAMVISPAFPKRYDESTSPVDEEDEEEEAAAVDAGVPCSATSKPCASLVIIRMACLAAFLSPVAVSYQMEPKTHTNVVSVLNIQQTSTALSLTSRIQ